MRSNKFRCMVCDRIRQRGVYVTVQKGNFKLYEVKVCKREQCVGLAKLGVFFGHLSTLIKQIQDNIDKMEKNKKTK